MAATKNSVAAASSDDHVLVLVYSDAVVDFEVDDWLHGQFGGGTAGFGDAGGGDEMDECLHHCVIGGVHVGVERKRTFPVAVVGRVTRWCYHPVLWREACLFVFVGYVCGCGFLFVFVDCCVCLWAVSCVYGWL